MLEGIAGKFINLSVDFFQESISRHGVGIFYSIQDPVNVEDDPSLTADRRMLRTVLGGLLKNAVENRPFH